MPHRGRALVLLWPNELVESTAPGPADPTLARELEERGFVVSGSGRLALGTRDQMQMGTGAPVTPLPEVASSSPSRGAWGPPSNSGRRPTSRSRGCPSWPTPARSPC